MDYLDLHHTIAMALCCGASCQSKASRCNAAMQEHQAGASRVIAALVSAGVIKVVKPLEGPAHTAAAERIPRPAQNSGDACRACGNFTLIRSGTCLTCQTCGETTGCS